MQNSFLHEKNTRSFTHVSKSSAVSPEGHFIKSMQEPMTASQYNPADGVFFDVGEKGIDLSVNAWIPSINVDDSNVMEL